ncbi:hypothetical protein [Methylicorpusculum sp.]|nr:hypothetical protein [Methylicorpusculum sp.]
MTLTALFNVGQARSVARWIGVGRRDCRSHAYSDVLMASCPSE